MDRKIILTEDGSHTISIPARGVTYHSLHGAIQESQHVYIEAGFYGWDPFCRPKPLRIFEMGLGTGLNVLLTLIESEKINQHIYYEALELFPLDLEEARSLNYCGQLNRPGLQTIFEQIHCCEWEKEIEFSSTFHFKKSNISLFDFTPLQPFELVYFDAFDPNAQPELWTKEVFEKIFSMLAANGILVTYSSKGDVRRALQAAGFTVEKIPGAKGKREMIRAIKKV
jgi:tRNA U34 5-methylaminomethyl-2-thiouridine-forming methyltransferase MnmC